MDKVKSLNVRLSTISFFLAVVIFSIDISIPLGVAAGVPYIAVILIALWSPSKSLAIYLALFCTAMTLLGFFLSPEGGELWKVVFNRGIAISAIWVTAILAMKWKHNQNEMILFQSKMEIEKEKEKIYLATMHGAQHITNNLLNQLQLIKIEVDKHSDFDGEMAEAFDDILAEAASLMKGLSEVQEMDENIIRESVSPSIDRK